MKIYSMTATFGKLEHQQLTLQPGLNIIEAPNEWGKSTWCAFLMAMFYGLGSQSKSKKNPLPEKERYLPWSGSPMAGRIDLCWQGRDITIERTTRRRVPLGEFRAYETASGLTIPELTAENVGQRILGVEGSVYRRSGFIRFQDLPVTQDEALRRRLQTLVTTGDDSGSADLLESKLKDLKNKVRYNRSGLLPQAEGELDRLERELDQRRELDRRMEELSQRLQELDRQEQALRLHLEHLNYREAQKARQRVAQSQTRLEEALSRKEKLEAVTARLPAPEKIEEKLARLESFTQRWTQAHRDLIQIPAAPEELPFPAPYDVPEPMAMVMGDKERWESVCGNAGPGWFFGALGAAVLTALLVILDYLMFSIPAAAAAVGMLLGGLIFRGKKARLAGTLEEKYGSLDPERWERNLRDLQWSRKERQKSQALVLTQRKQQEAQLEALEREKASLCGGQTPETVAKLWQEALLRWKDLETTREELQWRQQDLDTLRSAIPEVPEPQTEDGLTYPLEDTRTLLAEGESQRRRLLERLGQLRGRASAMDPVQVLEEKRERLTDRVRKLEDTYGALALALDNLTQARLELQRRFAPVIVQRSAEYMSRLTGGRYQKLTLDQEFTLAAGTAEEDGVASILWRSDGTMDLMYLALRLAVAEELTPEAPLVLDDALIRFDETRMKAALALLQELSAERQILLFTCQDREKRTMDAGETK